MAAHRSRKLAIHVRPFRPVATILDTPFTHFLPSTLFSVLRLSIGFLRFPLILFFLACSPIPYSRFPLLCILVTRMVIAIAFAASHGLSWTYVSQQTHSLSLLQSYLAAVIDGRGELGLAVTVVNSIIRALRGSPG